MGLLTLGIIPKMKGDHPTKSFSSVQISVYCLIDSSSVGFRIIYERVELDEYDYLHKE